jgi:hypothetical protein
MIIHGTKVVAYTTFGASIRFQRRLGFFAGGVLACTLLKRLCQFGVVVSGGGFAASLDEFFKAWGNLFPDVVRSKSRRQCETNPT